MPGLTTLNGGSDTSSSQETSTDSPMAGRRSSGRVKARPATYDASPQMSIEKFQKMAVQSTTPHTLSPSKTASSTAASSDETPKSSPSKQFKSYPMRKRAPKDSPEADPVFKKPAPIAKPKATKGPLSITIKKGKVTSGSRKTLTVGPSRSSTANEKSLFVIVRDGRSAMQSVINDWIESYNQDKAEAMTELIQFFVQCSGCNASVTRPMIEAEDTVQAIRHLTENFGEEAEEYPLIITKPEYKKFKTNFIAFVIQLINLCQNNIIYDEEMMDILICWVIGLTDSPVRAFRHTSTLAGMKIVTGLIEVANKVSQEAENTQRQINAEEQKPAKQKSREKTERLGRRKDELEQNKTELEDMVNRLFSSIFIHRYRDSRPEIRLICIAEMGEWMNVYSSYFLDQNYLKYLGWTLYDKVGDVRLGVLKALEKLYSNEDYLEHLELFTERFKDRLIHMTLDVETEVSVQAIKIASLLYKYDAIEEDDCSQVEQLVFCDQRRMAHAAGEFLALRIIRLSIEASPQKMLKVRKGDYLRQMNIKAILDFFIKTEIHDHCSYLIDSLWEHTSLLKDWKTMTCLLLDPNPLIELEDIEESALIDLMCCACKQAATATPPPGRVVSKKLSQKEKKQHEDDRFDISVHFMEHLPSLVEKYKADVVKVRDLLTIPQYFNLEIYPEKRLTKRLDDLLNHMEDVVLKHADTELLEVCSQTYHYLMDNELVIQQAVEVSRNRLLDEIVEKFRVTIADGIPTTDEDKDTQTYYNFVTGLKRINAFYRNHDLADWAVYEDINVIIDQGVNGNVDDEVLILAVHIVYMSLLMNLASLDPDKDVDKAELKQIRRRQKKYVKLMDELLQFGSVPVQTEVFKVLCDFFVYFAKQLLNKTPQFAPIVCEADSNLQVHMRDFITFNVFNSISDDMEEDDEEDDSKAQELYNKRTLLCGLCKLIGFRMFDMKLAAPIYAQFLKAYAHYSDIIKQLMHKAKEGDIIAFSKVLLFALKQTFESIRDDQGGINKDSDEFHALKDLARRFALMLGVNVNSDNTRKSTITIHREGILYAFTYPTDSTDTSAEKEDTSQPPPNLLFLEVLQEFTYRLIKIDRKVVIAYLEKTAGSMLNKKGGAWQPAKAYKNSISHGTASQSKYVDRGDDDDMMDDDVPTNNRKNKSKTISFSSARVPHGDKSKVKKKLSMSSASTTTKKYESVEKKTKPTNTQVARGIPKAPTRTSNRATRVTYEEAPDLTEDEDETQSEESEAEQAQEEQDEEEEGRGADSTKIKMVVKRTSTSGDSWEVSPSKSALQSEEAEDDDDGNDDLSPRKQYSSRSRTSLTVETISITSTTPTKKSSPAKKTTTTAKTKTTTPSKTPDTTPRKRGRPRKDGSASGGGTPTSSKSSSPSNRKRKLEDTSADSSIGSESGFADSINSNSPSQRTPSKKPRKSYSMRSGNTPEKLAEKMLYESLMYPNTAVSRQERLAKRLSKVQEATTATPTESGSQSPQETDASSATMEEESTSQ